MLPIVTEPIRSQIIQLLTDTPAEWKREMVHRLKQVNPEVNAMLLDVAQQSSDPKGAVLAGFAVYQALELAMTDEDTELGL